MARSTCVIGLSRPLIEGFSAAAGEGGPRAARPVFAAEGGANGRGAASLADFLSEAHWEPGVAVVVLPTDQATFRRLKFPFREQRRIRQVIRFELEQDVLDDIAQFTIDHEIAPLGEAGSEVQAYLVKSESVQAAVSACRAAGLSPYRVTLSAHALLAAHPPAQPLAFQVYAGAEESFVALVREGRIESIRSVATDLSALVLELQRQGVVSPQEIHRVLAGESESDNVNRTLVRSRMLGELNALAGELNLFLRVHDQGPPFAVEFFGLFGAFLRWGEARQVEVVGEPARSAASPPRRFLGILDELQTAALTLRSRQGVNFHAAGYGVWGQLAELRRPLVAAAALLALVIVLAVAQYGGRTWELWRQRAGVEAQIQAVIRKNIASSPPLSMGLPILRERVQKAREEAKGTARFSTYQYDALTLLSDLSGAIGDAAGITVESLTFGKDRLALVGTTPSFQASEALKNRLAGLAPFKGKEPKLTHQRAGQTITFRLTID
jgi:hypothetical protein